MCGYNDHPFILTGLQQAGWLAVEYEVTSIVKCNLFSLHLMKLQCYIGYGIVSDGTLVEFLVKACSNGNYV